MSDTPGTPGAPAPGEPPTPPAAPAAQAAPAAPPAGSDPATPPAATWTDGLSETDVGYLQHKGFEGLGDVVQSYRSLEKLQGVPEQYLVRVPKPDADPATWDEVYDKLGRPSEAAGYELPTPEGQADTSFAEWAQGQFHALGLSKTQGQKLAEAYNEYAATVVERQRESYQAAVREQDEALQQEWGADYKRNIETAKRAAREFGFQAEKINEMEQQLGFSGLMKHMLELGKRLGEDTFVGGGDGDGFGMSAAHAKAQLDELSMDSDFMAAWMDQSNPGHKAAVAKKARLTEIAFGGAN